MAFQQDFHARVCDTAPPSPTGHRHGQTGQQRIVDAAANGIGHRVEQRRGHLRRDGHRQMPHSRLGVDSGIQCRTSEQRIGGRTHPMPQFELTGPIPAAASASACAHRRIDVPCAGNSTGCPCVICCQAATKSGIRIRHDTPSTAR